MADSDKLAAFKASLDLSRDRTVTVHGDLRLTARQIREFLQILGIVPQEEKLFRFTVYYGNTELLDDNSLQIVWEEKGEP